MVELTEEIKGLTDEFHTKVANEVMKMSGKSALELARNWAKEGQPTYTADFLQFMKGVSEQEKREILALSYENEAVRKMAIGESLKKATGSDAGYSLEAQASLQRPPH